MARRRALPVCRAPPSACFLLASLFSGACQAQPVKGEATFSAAGGYARLVLKLDEDVDSDVSVAGSIVVIRFKRPVDITVDKLSDAVPAYVGSARRDPDGSAIRLSLARRVTVNAMTAGERIFVDLLPDSWSGLPPSLPQEVIRELSERARVAERALRQQRAAEAALKRAPVRVRASVQPTFVRFVFELPDGASVSSALNEQKLALVFNTALTFDLADAQAGRAIERRLDQPEDRGRKRAGRSRADRRCRCPFVPRRQELHRRYRLPVGKAVAAGFAGRGQLRPSPPHPTSLPTRRRRSDPATSCRRPRRRLRNRPGLNPSPSLRSSRKPRCRRSPRLLRAAVKETPAPAVVASPPKIALAAAEPPAEAKPGNAVDQVDAKRNSDGLRLTFSFAAAAPAALVPPRRCGVADFRFRKAARSRTDPPRGRIGDRRCQRRAAGERAGDPPAPQPPATGLADGG